MTRIADGSKVMPKALMVAGYRLAIGNIKHAISQGFSLEDAIDIAEQTLKQFEEAQHE